MYDVLVLTESRYVQPTETDPYIENVLLEDQLVVDALRAEGLKVERVDWADPEVDWEQTRCVLFRTTWDYFDQFDLFQQWMNQLPASVKMINPESIIRWNIDKHYLKDLENQGINIPPTLIMEQGDPRALSELLAETGWEEVILKPCISGGAKNTFRLNHSTAADHEGKYRSLIAQEAFMLQPLQHNVLKEGELSLMVFGGIYTHAVQKIAKSGDFRVQDDWGGTVHSYEASDQEIRFAIEAAQAIDPLPAYARVDVIRDNHGHLAIMELELIEPELWFRIHPDAARVLAQTIAKEWL